MIPSPSSPSSGEPDHPKLTESEPSDWRADLLDAVQQRDAPRAIILAQRCVHRYGIDVLESLLESVSSPEGDGSDARVWLLPLLLQPTPLQPSIPPPSIAAEANLDAAFAPLEIAFPPLPSVVEDPIQKLGEVQSSQLESEHLQTVPPPFVSLAGTQPDDPPDEWRSESMSALQASPEPSEAADPSIAAPIPRFEGDGVSDQRSFALPKERRQAKRAFSRPAPISPALQPWISWLHDGGTSSRGGS